jgi:prohibitin 1
VDNGFGNPQVLRLLLKKKYIMKTTQLLFMTVPLVLLFSSCAIVRQGEVGLKRKMGKLEEKSYPPGTVGFNPFTTKVIKISTQTENVEVQLDLPSKEGLTIRSQISILYHLKAEAAAKVLQDIGTDYENTLILAVFRSAAADVSARFMAKDMHTGERATIEKDIASLMNKQLNSRGFDVEAVLLKSIQLPQGLSLAIQQKLEAEQEAQRMEFVLDKERREAERKKIEAEGLRDAQKIISEGLNDFYIKWKSLEVFRQLSQSNNAKIIITDGKAPMLIDGAGGK